MNSETKDTIMEYTSLEELQSVYSDMYKEANGIRPRNVDPAFWNNEEALLSEINWLGSVIERELNWEAEEAAANAKLEAELAAKTAELCQVHPLRVGLVELAEAHNDCNQDLR